MGNIISVQVPLTGFEEKGSLDTSCCTCRKDAQSSNSDSTDAHRRRRASNASSNMAAARNAPYTTRLDIEGSTPWAPNSNSGTGFLDCKNSGPEPLTNWTAQEQQVLIDSLNKHPQARENESYRQRLIERVRRNLPNKSLGEIRECYTYLRDVRLACVKCSPTSLNEPVSPNNGGKSLTFET